MTGLLHEREFSRKTFVRGGGALIVGMSLAGAGLAGKAAAAAAPTRGSIPGPPDPLQIDSWIAIHADNTATIYSGRIELGQGTSTGMMMIAGEELDMDIGQLRWAESDSNVTPDSGVTVGSSSIRTAGPMVRAGAASAKQALLALASTSLGVPVASLSVAGGVVSGGGKTVTYGQLIGDKLFSAPLAAATLNPGQSPAKPASAYKLVTTRVPRIDIPDKVTGKWTYLQNIHVPGMLHGRVVRPRGQAGYSVTPVPLSVDESSIKNLPDVQIVRKGNFLAVVSPHEYNAVQAAAELKVKWQENPILAGNGNLFGQMRNAQTTDVVNVNTGNVGNGFASAAKALSASFTYDYQMHGPIGPSMAIATVTSTSATVLTNTQGSYRLRGTLASLLGMPATSIRVQYWEGASAFGHCTSDDAAHAAAITSQALGGKPVRLQFMRWDDHGWDCYGPAELNDVRGAIDANGKIVAIDYTSFVGPLTNSNNAFETTYESVGFGPITPQAAGLGGADTSSTGGQYNIPNRRVTTKSLPLNGGYLKTAQLRSPGTPQAVFAFEQMIDELAHAANMDPVDFRKLNITTTDLNRYSDALTAVVAAANWKPRVAASNLSKERVVTGRGIAMGTAAGSQAAVIAEIQVDKKTGKIKVLHMYAAQNSGITVAPNLLENQIVGNMVQTASRSLYEQITFSKNRVTSLDWVTYPIMRFKDAPSVTPIIVQRLDLAPTGGGEPGTGSVPGAIANAFFDATGVRLRAAPMTAGRVRAALKAAGVD